MVGFILISMFVFYQVYILLINKDWSLSGNLPIHLTNFILFFLGFNLIFEKQIFFDLSFFWGVTGGLLSVLFPDIGRDFPDVYYIFHWLSHAPMIFAVVLGFYPSKLVINLTSLFRAIGFGAVYFILVYPLNFWLNSNYGYLRRPPGKAESLVQTLAVGNQGLFVIEVFLAIGLIMFLEYLLYVFIRKKLFSKINLFKT